MNGSQIGPFNLSTRTSANGVWDLGEIAQRIEEDIWPTAQDPNFSSVKFLVHGNGYLNHVQPYEVSDPANNTVNFAGAANTVPKSDTLNAIFPQASFRSRSTSAGLLLSLPGAVVIGTKDFTLEGFFRPSAITGAQVLFDLRPASTNGNYPTIYMPGTSGVINYYANSADRITASAISNNTVQHIAYTKTGGTGTLWVAGASVGTWSDSITYASINQAFVAQGAFGGSGLSSGWTFDELRLTVGVARYTSAFTPSTTRFPDY